MADRRNGRSEGLGGMHAGRRQLRWHSLGDEQGARNLAEGHAQRAVDKLRCKADEGKRQQDGWIGQKIRGNDQSPPCYPPLTGRLVGTRQAILARRSTYSAFHYGADTLNWGSID
jgi:hypothetical protein